MHGKKMRDGSVRCRVCLAAQARAMRAERSRLRRAAVKARGPRPIVWISALSPVQLREARAELEAAMAPVPGGRPKGNRLKRVDTGPYGET